MRKTKVSLDNLFISADLHLGHDAEYVYKTRGFDSIGAHDRFMIQSVSELPSESTLLH